MMDRKVRVAKRPRATRGFHATKTQSRRGTKLSLERIAGPSRVPGKEHDFEHRAVDGAREALTELFDLLEEYAPIWYTELHRNRALAALKTLKES